MKIKEEIQSNPALFKMTKKQSADLDITINSLVGFKYERASAPNSARLPKSQEDLTVRHGADGNVIRVSVQLLQTKGTVVGKLMGISNRIGHEINQVAMPMKGFAGISMLPATRVKEVMKIYDDGKAELEAAKIQLAQEWDYLIQAAKVRLGTAFEEVDEALPTMEEFRDGFLMEMSWIALPNVVSDEVLGSLTREVARKVKATSQKAVTDMLERSHAAMIEDLIKDMTDLLEKIPKAKRVRNEPFEKLVEDMSTGLKSKNFMNSKAIDKLAKAFSSEGMLEDLKNITDKTPDERKEMVSKITVAREQAKQTLASMGI